MKKIDQMYALNAEALKITFIMQELSQTSNLDMGLKELLVLQERERSLLKTLEEAQRAITNSQKKTLRSIYSARKNEKIGP